LKLLRGGDVVVLALAAALVGSAYGAFWSPRSPGQYVVVTVGGVPVEERLLGEADELDVRGVIGHSRIRIEDGRVRFVDSPCHARYCVHAGWMSQSGQVAACLPNGVVVEVTGGERAYDAINL
jgi:hypothetical protein